MKNVTPFPVSAASNPMGVIALNCVGEMFIDPVPLRALFARKSDADAEEIICRMLEDIAVRLDVLQRGLLTHDFDMMMRPARRIALVASQIGLLEVVTAAEHVRTCLTQEDGVALEATIARLERSFDVAVNEVWSFQDH